MDESDLKHVLTRLDGSANCHWLKCCSAGRYDRGERRTDAIGNYRGPVNASPVIAETDFGILVTERPRFVSVVTDFNEDAAKLVGFKLSDARC